MTEPSKDIYTDQQIKEAFIKGQSINEIEEILEYVVVQIDILRDFEDSKNRARRAVLRMWQKNIERRLKELYRRRDKRAQSGRLKRATTKIAATKNENLVVNSLVKGIFNLKRAERIAETKNTMLREQGESYAQNPSIEVDEYLKAVKEKLNQGMTAEEAIEAVRKDFKKANYSHVKEFMSPDYVDQHEDLGTPSMNAEIDLADVMDAPLLTESNPLPAGLVDGTTEVNQPEIKIESPKPERQRTKKEIMKDFRNGHEIYNEETQRLLEVERQKYSNGENSSTSVSINDGYEEFPRKKSNLLSSLMNTENEIEEVEDGEGNGTN